MTASLAILKREEPSGPPVNYDVEQSLLACLLNRNESFDSLPSDFGARHFADPVNAEIFAVIADYRNTGQAVDAAILAPIFEDDQRLENIGGGRQYLDDLQANDMGLDYAVHYAAIVKDYWLRRRIHVLGQRAMQAAHDRQGDDGKLFEAPDALELVEAELTAITRETRPGRPSVTVSEAAMGALQGLEEDKKALMAGRPVGLPTGIASLDKLVSLRPGNLAVIAGRTSMGKSLLAGSIAANVAQAGQPVVVWSGEMSHQQLGQRTLARFAKVDLSTFRTADVSDQDWDKLFEAEREMRGWPLDIEDTPGLTVAALRSRVRQAQRHRGGHLALVVVDYLGLLQVPRDEREGRYVDTGNLARDLKAMAMELEVPVIALHQLHRGVENRDDKRPNLADLRDSGQIEEFADSVIFIYRPEYYLLRDRPQKRDRESEQQFLERQQRHTEALSQAAGIAELIIAKQRQGPTGECKARFSGKHAVFEDLYPHAAPEATYQEEIPLA